MKLSLTKKEKRELLDELGLEHDRRSADRIRAILLLDQGESVSDIANFLFLNETTIRNYKSRYDDGGLEGLVTDDYAGRSSYLSKDQKGELNKELESKVYPTTKSIISFVKDRFGVKYTVNGMTSLLHNLDFSYKKTTGVPGKADIDQQKEFIRKYRRIRKEGLVYFADSTHPMLNPVLSSGWIKRGKEFAVKTNSGRERVNINGAIEINSLSVISRSCESVDSRSMCSLLRAIRAKHPLERNLYLVLDNAPYNRSYLVQDLAKVLKVRILYLPPYSPNLNPIERFWKFVKKRAMANTYFPDVETFQKELMLFLRGVRKYRPELSTLITDNFHLIKT